MEEEEEGGREEEEEGEENEKGEVEKRDVEEERRESGEVKGSERAPSSFYTLNFFVPILFNMTLQTVGEREKKGREHLLIEGAAKAVGAMALSLSWKEYEKVKSNTFISFVSFSILISQEFFPISFSFFTI